jgi:hypothetical protein
VVLVPGPPVEVRTVQLIYRLFVDEGRSETEIAAVLNAERVLTDLGRPWTRGTVHEVLTNEKYIGNNVYNRISFKLKRKRVTNGREMWVRREGAFEAVVDAALFSRARAIIDERSRRRAAGSAVRPDRGRGRVPSRTRRTRGHEAGLDRTGNATAQALVEPAAERRALPKERPETEQSDLTQRSSTRIVDFDHALAKLVRAVDRSSLGERPPAGRAHRGLHATTVARPLEGWRRCERALPAGPPSNHDRHLKAENCMDTTILPTGTTPQTPCSPPPATTSASSWLALWPFAILTALAASQQIQAT